MRGMQNGLKELLFQAEKSIIEGNPKANSMVDELYLRANDMNDHEALYWYEYLLALIGVQKGSFSSAHESLETLIDVAQENHYTDLKIKVLKTLGDIHSDIDDFNGALNYYLTCLEIDSALLYDVPDKAEILGGIGDIYSALGQFEISKDYYYQGIKLCIAKEQIEKVAALKIKLAHTFILDGQMEEALKLLNAYFGDALSAGNDRQLGLAYHQYANYYWRMNDIQEATAFFEKAINKMLSIGMANQLCTLFSDYGKCMFENKNLDKALELLSEASLLLLDYHKCEAELSVYLYLAKVYEAMGNQERAFKYFKRYHELKTIKDETWKTIKIKNIVNKYEYLRSDLRVKELETTNNNLQIISNIGRDITSTIELNSVIKKISERVFELFDSKTFIVGRMQGNNKMHLSISAGKVKSELTIKNTTGRSYIFQLLDEQEFVNCFRPVEVINRQLFVNEEAFKGVKSFISSPLIFNDESIGIIMVQSDQEDGFVESQLEVLRILASYISIAINNSIKSHELIETNMKLKELTEKDGLTKVYNRYALNRYVKKILKQAYGYKKPFGIIMIDVDFFKEYNDNYGHLAGDRCLVKVSKALSKQISGLEDQHMYNIFRYGGDEFMLIIMNIEVDELFLLSEALRRSVTALKIEHKYSKCADIVTLTVGVGVIKSVTSDYEVLFAIADKALYNAKRMGRNNVKMLTYE